MAYKREFLEWLRGELGPEGEHLKTLLSEMERQRNNYRQAAVQKGDTEFPKGQLAALEWAVDLPYRIVKNETVEEPISDSTKIGDES